MDFIAFNSRNKFYKSKFGAVAESENFKLRLILPRSFCTQGAFFMLKKDNEEFIEYPMYWAGMNGDDKEIWDIEMSIHSEGLYFYHFDYTSAFGRASVFNSGSGIGNISSSKDVKNDFQITVYSNDFKTPEWLKGGIIYQIFPDRFFNSKTPKKDVPKDRVLRSDTENQPYWKPDENGKVLNNDYFCGDLKGIEQKLSYLYEMSVSCIYLNPIFEAHSNHRYNTADYMNIDPLLGTNDDFKQLCASAKRIGIRIILDGVFSHTGDDSRYFNKYKRYETVGAYNSKSSKYYSWYSFLKYPNKYKSWWGFETLPEVNETSPEYMDFISGENGVIKKWLSLGASGWRLDVADELPDEFIDALRKSIKEQDENALLLGEVWEDATTKFAYGNRRRYLLGEQLDSVMNYPFANAVLDFARIGDAESFMNSVCEIIENYPKPALDVMMNHIGTHDTQRAITYIAGESCEYRDREWQSKKHLSNIAYKKGVKLLKLAATIQYMLPGVPSVYYGDEVGMQGYKDPFNRSFYPWGKENRELLDYYIKLGKIRRSNDVLKKGEFYPVSAALSCIAFERYDDKNSLLIIANKNEEAINYVLPVQWQYSKEILYSIPVYESINVPAFSCVILRK
ncbi:MAG: glycoside hydrolase family 13 protein [Oscillospiraceae bacterium]